MSTPIFNITSSSIGNIINADSIKDSFNSSNTTASNDNASNLLAQLMIEIESLAEKASDDQKDVVAMILRDAQDLVAECALNQPRKRRYQIYLEEIRNGAMALGTIARPILWPIEVLKRLLEV